MICHCISFLKGFIIDNCDWSEKFPNNCQINEVDVQTKVIILQKISCEKNLNFSSNFSNDSYIFI